MRVEHGRTYDRYSKVPGSISLDYRDKVPVFGTTLRWLAIQLPYRTAKGIRVPLCLRRESQRNRFQEIKVQICH